MTYSAIRNPGLHKADPRLVQSCPKLRLVLRPDVPGLCGHVINASYETGFGLIGDKDVPELPSQAMEFS